MGIGTSSRAPSTPFVVQLIATTKPISPLRSGIGLKIVPLLFQTFTMLVQVTIVITEHVKGNENIVQKQVEHVDFSFHVLDSGVGPLEFLNVNLPLTPHQIGISQLGDYFDSNTPHALEVFMTPIVNFE